MRPTLLNGVGLALLTTVICQSTCNTLQGGLFQFSAQEKRRLTQEQYEKDYQEVRRDDVDVSVHFSGISYSFLK